jgi:hypothetical protein
MRAKRENVMLRGDKEAYFFLFSSPYCGLAE